MKIKARREFRVSLESLAFTDIILNIFIFFFTAFSLVYTFNPLRESKIIVKLPQADVKIAPDQKEPIVVNINHRNEIFLGKKLTNIPALEKELRAFMAFNKHRPVIVRADKSAILDRVVQVLEAAKKAGVEQLGIATEESPHSPPSKP